MLEQRKCVKSKKSIENLLVTAPYSPSLLCHSGGGGRGFCNKGVNLNLKKNACVRESDVYFFGFVSLFCCFKLILNEINIP